MDTDDVRDNGKEQDEQDEQNEQERSSKQEAERRCKEVQDEAAKVAATSSSKHQPDTRSNGSHKSLSQGSFRNKSRSITPQNSTRSQTHPPLKRNWRSANAFINFVQDYKKDYPDVMGGNIFQICGERWKAMTDEQKQPYIDAAQTVKRLKQRKCMDSTDQSQKKSCARVTKKKPECKRKETSQKKSKANKPDPKSNSDTDTATTTVHSSMSDADSF